MSALVADNRYSGTKCAAAVVARKGLTSSWRIFKLFLAPFALIDILCYELLLIVGNAPLYQASPGHPILGTNFPGTRLDVTPFECHFERVLVTFPGCASGSVSRIKFTKRTLALEIGSLAFGQYAQATEAAIQCLS